MKRHKVLAGWNRRRLGAMLLFFFLALLIPTSILIKHAYSQLKWEVFHNHRIQAEEVVARIDERYRDLIEIESERSFTDYTFLNISGDAVTQVLQRSPLTHFPVKSAIPGVLGYFQVDAQGHFTTPLLPDGEVSLSYIGIAKNEYKQRQKLHSRLYMILSKNNLIQQQNQKWQTPGEIVVETNIPEGVSVVRGASPASSYMQETMPKNRTPNPAFDEDSSAQYAFDNLQQREADRFAARKQLPSSLGRVEDLKLERRYRQELGEQHIKQQDNIRKPKEKHDKKSLRKERNVLPSQKRVDEGRKKLSLKDIKDLPISIFESEIDEFEFSILESGHFVLYRNVWRNGQRYIQGMLIESKPFISDIAGKAFYSTGVADYSNLAVAYHGNVLSAFNARSYERFISSAHELQGTLLLHDRLSTVLSDMEMIFSVDTLPAGPGAGVLNTLSVILLMVLCGGFWLMYRLGNKQIILAQQQQDFVSAITHELKTPLTSIRMYGEILRDGWASETKRKTYYDYIYIESERLTRLINNVLQLARMTRSAIEVNLKVYKVSELIDMLQSKLISQVDHAGYDLRIDCDENAAKQQIKIDADYFSQIMINLVDNAIKFSIKSDVKRINVTCKNLREGGIQFSVRDYGPGIPKDQMRKIFTLFYRTESELTRETVGTGIGLALVKQLVASMSGKIDVVNQTPGAEFRLIFPCTAETQTTTG